MSDDSLPISKDDKLKMIEHYLRVESEASGGNQDWIKHKVDELRANPSELEKLFVAMQESHGQDKHGMGYRGGK